MTRPYKLSARQAPAFDHPLHWSNFWPKLQRMHRAQLEARQDLVLWLANLHQGATKHKRPLNFCAIQLRLLDLRNWVRDYRPALDYFFEIKQLGYYIDQENNDVTTLVPKKLPALETKMIAKVVDELDYQPPPRPESAIISKTHIEPNLNLTDIIGELVLTGRSELIPQVRWLLQQPSELNFHFVPSGKLQQRDTSVWPIQAIETWPSWLREKIFGPGIDLDSAYIQFLVQCLEQVFDGSEQLMKTLFSDLLRLLYDKETFRKEICTKVLHKPYVGKYKQLVKRLIMSLANGSKISPALLTNGKGFSLTADLIIETAPDIGTADLIQIGERLQRLAAQFTSAKRYACMLLLKQAPNRKNVKHVFSSYFAWERAARYAIWEAVDRHGIMVHDGLDGVPKKYLTRVNELITTLGLRLTV